MNKLYVGNIPFEADEEDLENFFYKAGYSPADIKLCKDRDTGKPRGFGFVTLQMGSDPQAAISRLNGELLQGRKLIVREAEDRSERYGSGDRRQKVGRR